MQQPHGALGLFSIKLVAPTLTNTPGKHCCGPPPAPRAAPEVPWPEEQLRLGAGSPGSSRHSISCCSPPSAELQGSLSALLGFINSSLESAAKRGVGQLSADRAATRNQHLQESPMEGALIPLGTFSRENLQWMKGNWGGLQHQLLKMMCLGQGGIA